MLSNGLTRNDLLRDPIKTLASKQGRPLSDAEITTIEEIIQNDDAKSTLMEVLHNGLLNQAAIISRAGNIDPERYEHCRLSAAYFSEKPTQNDAIEAFKYVRLALLAFPKTGGPVGKIAGSLVHAGHKHIGMSMISMLTKGHSRWEGEKE